MHYVILVLERGRSDVRGGFFGFLAAATFPGLDRHRGFGVMMSFGFGATAVSHLGAAMSTSLQSHPPALAQLQEPPSLEQSQLPPLAHPHPPALAHWQEPPSLEHSQFPPFAQSQPPAFAQLQEPPSLEHSQFPPFAQSQPPAFPQSQAPLAQPHSPVAALSHRPSPSLSTNPGHCLFFTSAATGATVSPVVGVSCSAQPMTSAASADNNEMTMA